MSGPRSAYSRAPRLPDPTSLPSSCLSGVDPERRRSVVAAANASLQGFQDLSRGTVSDARPSIGPVRDWFTAPPSGRRVAHQVLRDVVEDFTIMGDLAVGECRSSVEEDAAAFRFVTAKAGPGVSGDLVVEENSVAGVDSAGRPRLPRGALV